MRSFTNLVILISLIFSVAFADDSLLVYTLDGKFTLVNRCTGAVRWTYDSGLVNDCAYSGDVIIIPEIHGGRLYEYPGNRSGDLLYRINSSIFEMVVRSPESINSLYTTGYKSDHWLQLDLDTGKILNSARCFSPFQCYSANIDERIPARRTLDLGMSEYHFMLWNLTNGDAKVNMTYQALSSHMESDLQTSNLTHVATLEPSIVTFEGCKFLWHLPLSAPVVDLFSVEAPPPPPSPSKVGETEKRDQANSPSTADPFLPMTLHHGAQCAQQSHRLRRIVFTTYALVLNHSYTLPHYSTQSALWEAKLGRANTFVPALYVGEADSPPIYAVHTLAEVALKPRHVHRVAEHLRLAYESMRDDSAVLDLSRLVMPKTEVGGFWPKSLIGLYYLSLDSPQINPIWSPPSCPPHHLFQLTDQSHSSGRPLLPMQVTNIQTTGFPKEVKTVLWTFSTVIVLIITVAVIFALRMRNRVRRYLHYQTPWDHASPLLHPSFDCADREGWAGHPVVSANTTEGKRINPETVRFNLQRVLGSGANGTIVFEGTYGTQPVAVKRILRRVELEKSWLREHRILMNHHHEHLIRCFWTGSSPNFHYLVLQRCLTSLLEALDTEEGAALSEGRNPLSRFGLLPVECVRQLLNAVVFLHSKSIVHRDIKPSNIFILEATPSSPPTPSSSTTTSTSAVNRLVLGDFGLSLPLENGFFINSICVEAPASSTTENGGGSTVGASGAFTFGSLGWMAPEMCAASKEALTQSVDVFAFGLVAYFILSLGSHPFFAPPEAMSSSGTEAVSARPRHLREVYTSLAGLQSMQKAINDLQAPRLNDLDNCVCVVVEVVGGANEEKPDKMRSCLAKQLILEALTPDPSNRCSIEVLAGSPLFWTAEDIMAFYTEISNFMDESKPLKFASGSGSFHLSAERTRPGEGGGNEVVATGPVDVFHSVRQHLSTALDDHWGRVFSSSWLGHLDAVLVDDLRSVRTYQDKSLTQLLRAIRNKRNHIWSLRNKVRDILGSSDTAMAEHWNSRFPSLLPLTYCLARVHLAEVNHFHRFLPASLTADAAERFISEHCHPSTPAMWARLSISRHGSPRPADHKVSPQVALPSLESTVNGSEEIAGIKVQTSEHDSPLQAKPRVWSKARTLTNPWHLPSKRTISEESTNNVAASVAVSEAPAAVLGVTLIAASGEMVNPIEGNEENDETEGFVLQKTKKRMRKRKTVPNSVRTKNL
ncbi:serine:threonine protein kinase:endoribonuclease [Echinococcus multilocularis]|uniref:Serine:threonine protein kinase:endoribonuclease n=1 Tax=Echinococcus multilocularis TaxID=6211 RepID=A0A087W0H3_ECHMU|nr:serine:threonine protein kinase:endoribonuclease [Echinococcus multilocularis]